MADASPVVDIAPIISEATKAIAALIVAVVTIYAPKIFKNKAQADAVIRGSENAAAMAITATQGALKGQPMNVNVGSQVLARGLQYMKDHVPDAAGANGHGDKQMLEMVMAEVGKLSGIDGAITDQQMQSIIASVNNKPPVFTAGDTAALIATIGQRVDQAINERLNQVKVPPGAGQQQPTG